MPLTIGTQLGSLEVVGLLGKGGMGEVYRARDTKLKRDIAIKILPEEFARDKERVSRFQREAEVLASLNHPHIAAIYQLEELDGTRFLVLEFVQGETLAERISRGAIPDDEALRIADDICEALQAAHDRGIVHRDLKPANVMISSDGAVKILDFGLAAIATVSSSDPSNSPTLTMSPTSAGLIVGTAAYMSPEQARGKAVDKRSDIWAFGVVLYEMLTGTQLFRGDTVTDILASVVKDQPDLDRIPVRARRLLQTCLDKDPQKRLQAIGDARLLIEESTSTANEASTRKTWVWPIAAAMFFVIAAAVSFVHFRQPSVNGPESIRFQIAAPDRAFIDLAILSPDGKRMVLDRVGADGVRRFWVRNLDSLEARPLQGTENHNGPVIWSPDNRFLAFATAGKLKRVSVEGGPAQTICQLRSEGISSGFWTDRNQIVFGIDQGGIFAVSASGGDASAVTTTDPSRRENNHFTVSLLPDGEHFFYTIFGSPDTSGVYVGSLSLKPDAQGRKKLLPDRFTAYYIAALSNRSARDRGYMMFVRESTLMAQVFNPVKLELTGEAIPLAGDVTGFSASENGSIAYWSDSRTHRQLTWLDRKGNTLGMLGESGEYNEFALSPDGTRIALPKYDGPSADTWIVDAARGTSSRLTLNPAFANAYPAWAPAGDRIAFASSRNGTMDLFSKSVNGGSEDLLLKSSVPKRPQDWSLDGRFLLYTSGPDPKTKYDLWILPMDGSGKPFVYAGTEFNEGMAQFSPDSRWVAYASDESGTIEVYVGSMPPSNDKKFQVSHGGGQQPHWRRDGKELFFSSNDENLMSVEIATQPVFSVGVPQPLFRHPIRPRSGFTSYNRRIWDVSADGQRFLFNVSSEPAGVTVWVNWQASLRK